MAKKVSVCIAAYNGQLYIDEQIRSVVLALENLKGWNWEIIVSDDKSTDNTIQRVLSFVENTNVRVVNGPRLGIGKNFENAIKHSTGDYIYFADQDDVWHVERITATIDHLECVDFVVCRASVVNKNLDILPGISLKRYRPGAVRNFFSNKLTGAFLGCRRSTLEKIMPFPPGSILHDEWISVLAPLYGAKFYMVDRELVLYRRHDKTASSTGGLRRPTMEIIFNRFSILFWLCIKLLDEKVRYVKSHFVFIKKF